MNTTKAQSTKIRGGLAFTPAVFGNIETIPLPATVLIQTNIDATLIVTAGDYVRKGQPLTQTKANFITSHASVSGVVTDTADGIITIESDGLDAAFTTAVTSAHTPAELLTLCHEKGLVGLGGAGFPVNKKLDSVRRAGTLVNTLLINAAECDPAIYCDEALMQERAPEIVKGITLAITASGAAQCIVGIEENKTLAIEQLQKHLPKTITLITVPAIYPSGAENKLYALCTGNTGSLKSNQSLCFNIATCYSIYKACVLAEPLISRIVTVVTESAVQNFELRIGTPIIDLQNHLGIADQANITFGGKMMGRPVTAAHTISKQTNCLVFDTLSAENPVACIRCGACADVCPEHLLPQQLFWHTEPYNRAALLSLNLHSCIDCACCDAVCPSHIPLAQHFIDAKLVVKKENLEQKNADLAKERFEKRQQRLESQSIRERKKLDSKSAKLTSAKHTGQSKQDLIAKALQRSKTKKKQSAHSKKPNSESNSNRSNQDLTP